MDERLFGVEMVSVFALIIDGGRPDNERDEPLAGGGGGRAVGDVR